MNHLSGNHMTAALMQDQWEAMQEGKYYEEVRRVDCVPLGYVPVPPVVIRNTNGFGFAMLEIKEDE